MTDSSESIDKYLGAPAQHEHDHEHEHEHCMLEPSNWSKQASKKEKHGLRALLRTSAAERDSLQSKLRERHCEMINLLDSFDRQKAKLTAARSHNKDQAAKLLSALEKIEILQNENLHIRSTAEAESQASAKHITLLKDQLANKLQDCKQLDRTLNDVRQDAADQRKEWESRVASEEAKRNDLEELLQMKIGETSSMHDTITGQQQENAILQGELKRLANVDQRNTQLEKKLSDTRSRNLKLNEDCAKASEARKLFEGELNLARTQIENLNREIEGFKAKLSDAHRNHELMKAQQNTLELKLTAEMRTLKHSNNQFAEAKHTVEELREENKTLTAELKLLLADKSRIDGETSARLSAYEKQIQDLRERHEEHIRDLRSRNEALSQVSDQAIVERYSSQEQLRQLFGDLKYNQCLASELQKRLEMQETCVQQRIEAAMKEREETSLKKGSKKKMEKYHLRKIVNNLSSHFLVIRRRQSNDNRRRLWLAKWLVAVYRRKWLRAVWHRVALQAKQGSASAASSTITTTAEEANKSNTPLKPSSSPTPIFTPKPTTALADIQQLPAAMKDNKAYHVALMQQMEKVGKALLTLESDEDSGSSGLLNHGYLGVEEALSNYYSYLGTQKQSRASGAQSSSKNQVAKGTRVRLERDLARFEAESERLSRGVTHLIRKGAVSVKIPLSSSRSSSESSRGQNLASSPAQKIRHATKAGNSPAAKRAAECKWND
eukprot:CAMPEP_0197541714 /NCGR_PEP_ID=MMETSP1318-20131121/67310_1 /TAXON_ID=552666 /ORGANISM="Partenskyella glossopodia, Strain RCC365" /LENGTH=722 /DNA_ID=CAMNT_0043100915 /DNA_START=472 /DNA_END=2640 /DNA_ORIENTATION=+